MKKILCVLSMLVLLLSVMGGTAVSAAGSATITASNAAVTIGDQVTVTATFNGGGSGIGSLDATFRYSTTTFE